jgi:hypothetical protein
MILATLAYLGVGALRPQPQSTRPREVSFAEGNYLPFLKIHA